MTDNLSVRTPLELEREVYSRFTLSKFPPEKSPAELDWSEFNRLIPLRRLPNGETPQNLQTFLLAGDNSYCCGIRLASACLYRGLDINLSILRRGAKNEFPF